ncbi:transposase, partial [Escherichia coli]|nr:IS66 family transposase [Escherichia coli]
MKTDILNTTQNPDELRRLAQDLLDKQTQRIHTLENDNAAIQAEKTALEQHIRGQEVMMLAATTAYEQRIRELEEALKLAQQWRFGRKSERLPASQKPLADEDAASDEADITRQLSDLLPPKEKTGKKPVRQLL